MEDLNAPPPPTRQEILMNSIRSRQIEIDRLMEANRVDGEELRNIIDRTTWLVFMASTFPGGKISAEAQ